MSGASARAGRIAIPRPSRFLQHRTLVVVGAGGYDALLVAALAALAAVFLIETPAAFGVDSWLALVAGREVWQNGIPHHEALTVVSHGAAWIDQQWLSQVTSYALYKVGGLGLLALANVTLITSGLAGAAVAARRLGASARTVVAVLPVCAWLVLPSGEVRTQAFAFPLFVATFYLLASDSRAPSRRVYWCLPLLVLWANLHGSASLGAGLVVLRGLTLAWDRRRDLARGVRAWRRPLALAVGGPLCLLLTPYGTSVLSYYRATLLSSTLKHAVTEWQPVTSSTFIAIPLFLLLALALWSFGRYPGKTTIWEKAAFIALGVGGIDAVRNTSFVALAGLIVVGVSLDGLIRGLQGGENRLRPRLNRAFAVGTLLVVAVAGIGTVARPARAFENARLQRVLAVVASATSANRSLDVLADQKSADWLLWRDPDLRGRVAFDVRFELLPAATLRQMQRLYLAAGPDWKRAARGYRLLVLDTKDDPLSTRAFLTESGHRVLYDDGRFVVILRGVS